MDSQTQKDFLEIWSNQAKCVEKRLNELVPVIDTHEKIIYDAMRYSLLAGGKRLRPVLALAVCELLGGDDSTVMDFGCAVEMIHTYSLIHDDLPAMDNDDYRRGKLTNHKVYGDAYAILAGDGLLNLAFETMISKSMSCSVPTDRLIKAMGIIGQASGTQGMIGGQVVDIASEGKQIDIETLQYMHRMKTGALIKAPVLASAAICGADSDKTAALDCFSKNLGLAFQIKDDILDVEGDSEKLGKMVGSDVNNKKSTYVSIFGIEKARELLKATSAEAITALDIFGDSAAFLKNLTEYLIIREN